MPAKKPAPKSTQAKKSPAKKAPARKAPSDKPQKKSAAKKAASKKPVSGPDKDMVERTIDRKAGRITGRDLRELAGRKKEMDEKLKEVPGKFTRLVNQVKLLYAMIKDYRSGQYKEVPWYTIAVAAAAILYFLTPLDFIPDWIPIGGYIDDAAVLAFCVNALRDDLRKYCGFKGCDPDMYF